MTTRGEKVHEGIPLASGCKRSEMVVDEVFPGTAFLVHGLFSEEECAHYVAESEKLGYRDIGSLYQKTYRTNDRLLLHSEELTQEAYRRLLPHLPRTMLVESGTSRSYWQTPDDAVEGTLFAQVVAAASCRVLTINVQRETIAMKGGRRQE